MSDSSIIVFPDSTSHVPSEDAQRAAIALFRTLAPDADEVTAEASDEVRFLDCGANLETIACPDCGAELDLDWWQERMDEEASAGFPLRPVELPCCRASRTLNELAYDGPQGFARFSLEARNPGIADLSEEQLAEIAAVLGCKVRRVLQHL